MPAALNATLKGGSGKDGESDHCGSAEGWKWLANGEYGEPVQERWASGFFKATSIKEPESLNAQDLFRWLSDVLQLSEDDIDRLLPCRDLPQATMSEHIYGRFVEFRAMRTHLQLTGETDLGHRKEMMRKYLTWFLNLRRGSTESYVGYLDKVGAVHQKGSRDVPCIQLFAGLGVTQDVVLRNLCKQIHDREKLCGTISSVSKLMWIQAVFFARHTLLGRRRLQPIWKGLAVLFASLAASRCSASLLRRLRLGSRLALGVGVCADALIAVVGAFAAARLRVV